MSTPAKKHARTVEWMCEQLGKELARVRGMQRPFTGNVTFRRVLCREGTFDSFSLKLGGGRAVEFSARAKAIAFKTAMQFLQPLPLAALRVTREGT